MKKLLIALVMGAFFMSTAFCRDWVCVSNNTTEQIEIGLGFGGLGMYLEPFQGVEFTYGDKIVLVTPFGVAAAYFPKGDITIELTENGYYINDVFNFYWTEGR